MYLRKLVLLVILCGMTYAIFAQDMPKMIPLSSLDSLNIKFLFPFFRVYDSSQLILKVVYKNNTNKEVSVYYVLEEGYKGDRFFNIAIEMEKLDKKNYKRHPLRHYQSAHASSLVDSLRHFDLPKKKLAPYASDTLALNILTVANSFLPGKYRFRAHLRVKTLRDNQEYNDPTFETPPPEDTIEYVSSQWFYLTIQNEIYIRMNPHE